MDGDIGKRGKDWRGNKRRNEEEIGKEGIEGIRRERKEKGAGMRRRGND